MADIDELLEDLDDEQADIVKAALKAAGEKAEAAVKQAELAQRQLRFSQDGELSKKYPRVVNAIRKGLVNSDDVAEAKLDEFLAAEEKRLTDLGVPDPAATSEQPAPEGEQVEKPAEKPSEPSPNEAAGWGRPTAPQPGAPVSNANIIDAIESGNISDILSAIHLAADTDPGSRGPGAFREQVEQYQDRRPIQGS